jgi:hypothetical protein
MCSFVELTAGVLFGRGVGACQAVHTMPIGVSAVGHPMPTCLILGITAPVLFMFSSRVGMDSATVGACAVPFVIRQSLVVEVRSTNTHTWFVPRLGLHHYHSTSLNQCLKGRLGQA